jgi:hypothetical protein
MKKKLDIKGVWWTPDKKENKLNGILHYVEDKDYLLELFSKFEDASHNYKYSIINGISSDGTQFTLVDCFIKTQVTSMPGFSVTTILVNIIFENIFFEKYEDITFRSVSSSFLFLDNWVHTNGFAKDRTMKIKDYSINYHMPDKIENNINDEFNLNINFIVSPPQYTIVQKKMQIKQRTEIEIVLHEDKDLNFFIDIIMYCKHFLMLAMNENTKKLYIKSHSIKQDNISTNSDKPVVIYIRNMTQDYKKNDVQPGNMIFSLPAVKNRLTLLLNTWFKNHKAYHSSYTLFFETLYYKGLNLENHFLNLTQALESYHRNKYGGGYMDKEEYRNTVYKKLKDSIPSGLEDDFREALKARIKFGYEYSLRRRLTELFRYNNKFLENFIPEYAVLKNEIVDTRNYYTHYDEKGQYVKQYSELFNLCEKIKVIFTSFLLFDLGFSYEEVKKKIEHQEMLTRFINVSNYDFKNDF